MGKKFRLSTILCFLPFLITSAGEVAQLHNTKKEKDPVRRSQFLDRLQQLADKTSNIEFDNFDGDINLKTSNPLLKFYDETLDHIKEDVSKTQVDSGNVVIWYLYNMGFIIKTPTVCFGVDIHHRRASELAGLLDFVAITHNHTDHYSLPLMRKMTRLGKPVVSNFQDNPYYTKEREYTHKIGGVTIHCGEADHNSRLKKFTMPLEIVCPTGNKNFVFFTSGDCRNELFLHRKSDHIDLYAVHPFCGMKPLNAAKKLAPHTTFIVHLLEMGHPVDRWRWSFDRGRGVKEIFDQEKLDSCIPVWGEKFLWDGEKLKSI